jgi:hypothetical protein
VRAVACCVVVVGLIVAPGLCRDANAGSNSLITLGGGLELGLGRYLQSAEDPEYAFIAEISIRLRLLRVLGVSFSYNAANGDGAGPLSFESAFRLTALLYLLPTRWVSVYVIGGLGAMDIRDVIDFSGSTTSYHLGVGLEVYIRNHFAIFADYLWIVPGYASMQATIQGRLEDTANEALTAGVAPTLDEVLPALNWWDFLDAGNLQVSIGVRFYI